MGEEKNGILKLQFDRHLRLEFRGPKVTTDTGLLAVRELDRALGLTEMAGETIKDKRTGRNVQHELTGLLRQSVYAGLAGYEDVNDQEGKYALTWTRLSCARFSSNQVRLSLFVLAYNLGNFVRRFALPSKVSHWSLRSIQLKLIKIGAEVISHARRTVFQCTEVAVHGELFDSLLSRIRSLASVPT